MGDYYDASGGDLIKVRTSEKEIYPFQENNPKWEVKSIPPKPFKYMNWTFTFISKAALVTFNNFLNNNFIIILAEESDRPHPEPEHEPPGEPEPEPEPLNL